ncbi:MAG: hypothetical protein KDK36_19560 [Leptospiraceae bacterium]|nr:hypothetical protein [Leptospiraceae bacterium]
MDTKRSRLQNYIWVHTAIICFSFITIILESKDIDSEYETSLMRALYYIRNDQLSVSGSKIKKITSIAEFNSVDEEKSNPSTKKEEDSKISKNVEETENSFKNDKNLFFSKEKKLNVAKQILEKIEITYEKPDYRYYAIRGELHQKLEELDEAIDYYEKSMKYSTFNVKEASDGEHVDVLINNQKFISEKLFKLYLDSRKLKKAFDFIRIYLATNPNDGKARYESIILASRLKRLEYFNKAISLIPKKSEEEFEKSFLTIKELIRKKKFSKALTLIEEEILYNPLELKLHNMARLCHNSIDPNSKEMETILLNTAAIFYKEKKHSLLLGNYYRHHKKKYQALNLYRRMFDQSLEKDEYNFDEEVLYLLRDWYHNEKRLSDELAISRLIEMGRRGDHQIEEELFSEYNVSKNREILVYLIFHLSHKDNKALYRKYQSILAQHDRKHGDSEFMNIFPVFDTYSIEEEKEKNQID